MAASSAAPCSVITQCTVESSSRPNADSNPSTRRPTRSKRTCVSRCAAQEALGLGGCTGNDRQLLARRVAAVGVARHQMALDVAQHMAQVLGIRAVDPLDVSQLQRFACPLQEVHQLVDFQQRHRRVHQPAEIAAHQAHQRRASCRHPRHCRRAVGAGVWCSAARLPVRRQVSRRAVCARAASVLPAAGRTRVSLSKSGHGVLSERRIRRSRIPTLRCRFVGLPCRGRAGRPVANACGQDALTCRPSSRRSRRAFRPTRSRPQQPTAGRHPTTPDTADLAS